MTAYSTQVWFRWNRKASRLINPSENLSSQILILAVRGKSKFGYIAIDDILFLDTCGSSPTPPVPSTPSSPLPPIPEGEKGTLNDYYTFGGKSGACFFHKKLIDGPALPFFHKRRGILKIDQSVKNASA